MSFGRDTATSQAEVDDRPGADFTSCPFVNEPDPENFYHVPGCPAGAGGDHEIDRTREAPRPCARCGRDLLFAESRLFWGIAAAGTFRICKSRAKCNEAVAQAMAVATGDELEELRIKREWYP